MTHLTRGAFALTVLCVLPIAAGAQQSTATSPAQYVVNNQTADRLLEQAVALEGEHSQRGDAAKLYARSADLRSYGDVRAHQAYQRAGWLLVGENPRSAEKARQMFVKAGTVPSRPATCMKLLSHSPTRRSWSPITGHGRSMKASAASTSRWRSG